MHVDEETRFELNLERLWYDMEGMTKEELENYTARLYTKLYGLKRNKSAIGRV